MCSSMDMDNNVMRFNLTSSDESFMKSQYGAAAGVGDTTFMLSSFLFCLFTFYVACKYTATFWIYKKKRRKIFLRKQL